MNSFSCSLFPLSRYRVIIVLLFELVSDLNFDLFLFFKWLQFSFQFVIFYSLIFSILWLFLISVFIIFASFFHSYLSIYLFIYLSDFSSICPILLYSKPIEVFFFIHVFYFHVLIFISTVYSFPLFVFRLQLKVSNCIHVTAFRLKWFVKMLSLVKCPSFFLLRRRNGQAFSQTRWKITWKPQNSDRKLNNTVENYGKMLDNNKSRLRIEWEL